MELEEVAKQLYLPSNLELRQEEGFGRGIFAKVKIQPGTELLTALPYVHSVSDTARGNVCDYCLSPSQSLRKCKGCKFVYYCNSTCQRRDWPVHKGECKGLIRISPGEATCLMRLVLRALERKRLLEEGGQGGDAVWDVDLLVSVPIDFFSRTKEDKSHEASFMTGMRQMCKGITDATPRSVHETIRKFVCNTFSVYGTELAPLAAAVYTTPSFINHSCVPNCVVVYTGRKLSLRTVQEVKAGDQLFISYTEQLEIYAARKTELERMYGFQCTCQRCRDDQAMSPDSFEHLFLLDTKGEVCSSTVTEVLYKALGDVVLLRKNNDWKEVAAQCQELVDKYSKTLDPRNIWLVRITENLVLGYLELKEWESALDCCSRLDLPYQTYYDKYNPMCVLHLVKTGKLRRHIGTTEHLKQSIQDLTKAVDLAVVVYGSGHPFTKEINEMLQDSNFEVLERTSKIK